ncbi:MAG: ABC transporter permease [Chloroflexota bacterium]|nr:ABC transporter permease [Chloroflexota bacterium]
MLRFIGIRVLTAIPVLFGVATIVFFMMRVLPGDPAQLMLYETGASGEEVEQLREQLGLNDPLYIQFWNYLANVVQGDFGQSFYTKQYVTTMLASQFRSTLELTLAAMLISTALGVTLGVISAIKQHTWVDSASMVFALAGVSLPSFWLGLMLIFLFSLRLGWLPTVGSSSLKHLILPAVTLGIGGAAIIARLVRSSMLEVLRQEYVVTARAKGLSAYAVTILGLQFGYLLGGTVVVETVFSRQGIGRLAVVAIKGKDFDVIQGWALFVATIYIFVNLLVDISYAWLDPRIRYR